MFRNKVILITGGSGFLGQALTRRLLLLKPKKIIIYSRSEYKQYLMQQEFNNDKLRFFIGDIRDRDRLNMALKNVDYVIHTAALKQVPAMEYNPMEAVKTNVVGAMNLIDLCIENNIKKVIALSTDKAVNPINLYGATKLCADKLFINGNALGKTLFSIVRYGNVDSSTGSVIPYFEKLIKNGINTLPITDARMTRFHIIIDRAIDLIFTAFKEMSGGEIFVAKIPSYKLIDLVKNLKCNFKIIGIRPGEKLHEIMITKEDAMRTFDNGKYYIIYPMIEWVKKFKFKGKSVDRDFEYVSNVNTEWMFK